MAGSIPHTFQPGSAAVPSTQVEISVSCRNLQDRDTFSKSDPVCVLFTRDVRTSTYYEFGRTEMIKDTLNPEFVKKFVMNYFFEESQKIKFEIYDVDSPSQRLDAHDFLGRIECTLGEIVGSSGGKLERPLIIVILFSKFCGSQEIATMQFRAAGLDKKDFLGKSDPFLIIYRSNEDGSFTAVHKSEVIKNNLNPNWRLFTIPVRTLCNGDYNRSIKIECFDWDSDGSHDLIGEFSTNLQEMAKASTQNVKWPVINPKKKAKKKSYKHSGEVTLSSCKLETQPSFLDYIKGGTELNFTVAIDFTASNGDPTQSNSLHYISSHAPNQYASAIQAVGEIIQDYDSDKMFPALGFGAKLPDGKVSHEFAVNFNPSNPYCQGINGVLSAYQNAIRQVRLYGPTNFSPVISHVARFASGSRDGSHYFVLLIITDGVITDMANTIEAIINASMLPMSIIIVGVGNDGFEAMDTLDADNNRLSIHGRYAERDIVQFVPFRNFLGEQYGNNAQISQAALAKEVLAEVPDQVIAYMKKQGIKPKPPREGVRMPNDAPQRPPLPQGARLREVFPPNNNGREHHLKGTPLTNSGILLHPQGCPLNNSGKVQHPKETLNIGKEHLPQGPPLNISGRVLTQDNTSQQWQGAPPQGSASHQQWQGAPPQGSASHQQWQGAPPQGSASHQQWQGAPPQGSLSHQQWQGAPPQGNPSQQWPGAPPQGSPSQQWPGAPPQGSSSQQWPGAPPQGGPSQQWSGASPQGSSSQQWPGAPPQGNPSQQWQGASPAGTIPLNTQPSQWQRTPSKPSAPPP
ncbi:hypothetical protein ScPMuIL_008419 [Solemya velum]